MKLNRNTYPSVKDMLTSSDPENIVMGLSCIENSTFKENLMYIGLLFLECDVRPELWKVHAPETTKLLRAIGFDIAKPPITFRTLLTRVIKYNVDVEDLKLFCDAYTKQLKINLNKELVDTNIAIDEIIISVKTKDNETRRTSKSS